MILPFLSNCQQKEHHVSNFQNLVDSIELQNLDTNIHNYEWRFSFGSGKNLGYVNFDTTVFVHNISFSGVRSQYALPDSVKWNPFYSVAVNQSGDIYYLHSDGYLYRLHKDLDPEIVYNFKNNKVLAQNGLMIENNLGIDRQFHFLNNSVVVIPVTWDFKRGKGKYANYKKPCPSFVTYNIQSDQMVLNNIWSEPQTNKNYYASRHMNYSALVNGKLIVSKPYTSEIEILDVLNNKVENKYLEKSQFQTDSIMPLVVHSKRQKQKLRDRYFVEEAYYGPIVYNEFRKEYYRIFYHALPTKNENGDFTIYSDKSSSIIVFDSNFKIKDEIYFDKDYFIFLGLTPTKDGIILNSRTSKKDGKYYIKQLRF